MTDDFGDPEAEADGGICERHDGGDDGKPPDLVEVWNLGEDDLRDAEDDHVRVAGRVARAIVAVVMEAV